MNSNTLELVLRSIKMTHLLSPVARLNKTAKNNIQALLNVIHAQAAYLVIHGTLKDQANEDINKAILLKTTFLAGAHDLLLTYLKEVVDVSLLIDCLATPGMAWINVSKLFKKPSSVTASSIYGTKAFADFAKNKGEFPLLITPSEYMLKQGTISHQLSSVSRNSSWLSLLLDLFIDVSKASTYATALLGAYGSRQGGQGVESLKKTLLTSEPVVLNENTANKDKPAPRSKANSLPKVVALDSNSYVCKIELQAKVVLQIPAVMELLKEIESGPPSIVDNPSLKSLESIISEAFEPVVVPTDVYPQECATATLNKFLSDLAERSKLVAKEKLKLSKKRELRKKEEVVEALKKMGPLLEVLKKNPDLLSKV